MIYLTVMEIESEGKGDICSGIVGERRSDIAAGVCYATMAVVDLKHCTFFINKGIGRMDICSSLRCSSVH